ncbi:DUF2283 domain-containing protein [Niveispirillum sp. KHB5.9]|uniref:DUF2283 domain-containing protein n=1 Tax=Niveispirillum sp. KHB5.9 TaxID=3400269 RepID=UPI003A8A0A7D
MSSNAVSYDQSTDSLYVKIRPGTSVRQRYDDARDVIIDLGADGEPVGYDIQFASKHADVIAEALTLLQNYSRLAA